MSRLRSEEDASDTPVCYCQRRSCFPACLGEPEISWVGKGISGEVHAGERHEGCLIRFSCPYIHWMMQICVISLLSFIVYLLYYSGCVSSLQTAEQGKGYEIFWGISFSVVCPERVKKVPLFTFSCNLTFLAVIISFFHLCISKPLQNLWWIAAGVVLISDFRSVPSFQPEDSSGVCLKSGFDHKSQTFTLVYRLSCPITLSISEAIDFFTCCYCLALFFPPFQPFSGKIYIVAHLCFSREIISEFPANLNKKTVICN